MIRAVLRMGDPRLLRVAQPVRDFGTPALFELLADLRDTMAHLGGVGIAAPQIGVDLQLVVFGFQHADRYPEASPIPETILINPVLEPLDEALEEGWEGCLSVPGLRGRVPRYRRLRYRGYDPFGGPLEREVDGFHARVVQHECDHLNGVLYPMRITDFAHFGFTDVLLPGVRP